MKILPAILGLGVLAAGAYYLAKDPPSSAPAVAAGPPAPGGQTRSSGGTGAGIGGVTAPLAALGPVGIGAAVAGGLVDAYNASTPEQQDQYRGWGDKLKSLAVRDPIFGAFNRMAFGEDPAKVKREKRKDLLAAQASITNETSAMELFITRAYAALSRPDVVRWNVDQLGTLNVEYAGRAGAAGPWSLPVPRTALNPAAWSQEVTSRIFGRPVQSGTGPVTQPLPLFSNKIGFSEQNPYAPRRWQAEPITGELLNLQGIVARSLRRPAPTEFQA